MDNRKILNADYLDLLFEGKNKTYGSYQLRKNYNFRMALGAGIAFLIFIVLFLTTLFKQRHKMATDVMPPHIITDVFIQPEKPHKKAKIIPPPLTTRPKKAMVKVMPPVIKKDNLVDEIDKPKMTKPDENTVIGPKTMTGADIPGAIPPDLATTDGGGTGVIPGKDNQAGITEFVDQRASFPGGEKALFRYLSQHVHYPAAARMNNIQGRVIVQFVVDEKGGISAIKILKDIGGGCADAVVKAIRKMPKWQPARNNHIPVKSYYIVPFSFKLQQ